MQNLTPGSDSTNIYSRLPQIIIWSLRRGYCGNKPLLLSTTSSPCWGQALSGLWEVFATTPNSLSHVWSWMYSDPPWNSRPTPNEGCFLFSNVPLRSKLILPPSYVCSLCMSDILRSVGCQLYFHLFLQSVISYNLGDKKVLQKLEAIVRDKGEEFGDDLSGFFLSFYLTLFSIYPSKALGMLVFWVSVFGIRGWWGGYVGIQNTDG